jgi:hypothetical protein
MRRLDFGAARISPVSFVGSLTVFRDSGEYFYQHLVP